jgi:hypothetical protein
MSSAARHPKLTRRGLHRQQGAVAFIVGLALDFGKLYVTRSELQNSADSCALSAARDLTSAIGLQVAEADGIAAGHSNFAVFRQNAVQMQTDSNVTFSDSPTNPFLTKTAVATPSNIKYVKRAKSLMRMLSRAIVSVSYTPSGCDVSSCSSVTVGMTHVTVKTMIPLASVAITMPPFTTTLSRERLNSSTGGTACQ